MTPHDRYTALKAMRGFVQGLPADQVHLFYQIATRYQGDAAGFRDAVVREFHEATARPHKTISEPVLLTTVTCALYGQPHTVAETVARITDVWNELQQTTREQIVSDIETAIAYRAVSGNEVGLWRQIISLPRQGASLDLDRLRQTAADTIYQAHDFGGLVVEGRSGWEQGTTGDTWSCPISIQSGTTTEQGHFVVRFEPGTAVVAESYGLPEGETLDATSAPSPR